jgi:Protein of unknown function (DUF2783)
MRRCGNRWRARQAVITAPNIENPDQFYAALAALHTGLSVEESLQLNAKLILLLANQVGDSSVLQEILLVASASLST